MVSPVFYAGCRPQGRCICGVLNLKGPQLCVPVVPLSSWYCPGPGSAWLVIPCLCCSVLCSFRRRVLHDQYVLLTAQEWACCSSMGQVSHTGVRSSSSDVLFTPLGLGKSHSFFFANVCLLTQGQEPLLQRGFALSPEGVCCFSGTSLLCNNLLKGY